MQGVFFDFDGVILDSVTVKTEAFAEMYARHGEEVCRAVVEYHMKHGGVSRHEKFRHFHEHILGQPMTDELMARLCTTFSKLTLAKVMAAPFIPGARETLNALADRGVPAFVASGTPQAELETIVLSRLGSKAFAEIHGSPRTKVQIVREIIARHGFTPARCVFVGDAMTDWLAASECAMPFVGVTGPSSCPFPDNTVVVHALSIAALKSPSPVTEPA